MRDGATQGIYQVQGQGHRIDLDQIEIDQHEMQRWEEIKPDGASVSKLDQVGVTLKGGYTISQMVTNSPKTAQDVVPKPNGKDGVTKRPKLEGCNIWSTC
eukprot:symbB.v1.2.003245.t1/scaffold180.1/size283405/4